MLACIHTHLYTCVRTQVEGDFSVHDAVSLLDKHGVEFGRGLVNYSSDELCRVKVSGLIDNDFWKVCVELCGTAMSSKSRWLAWSWGLDESCLSARGAYG